MADHDDLLLLRCAARGDSAAVATLLERHGRYLFGTAHALAGNAFDADDLLQETLMAALKSADAFRGESSLRTWMVKILVRQAALARRKRRRPTEPLSESADPPATAGSETGPIDARIDLTTMLSTLSPEHREIVLLREIEGLSYDEIAAALDLPRGTVESRLFRARQQLRQRFAGDG